MSKTAVFTSIQRLFVVIAILALATGSANARSLKSYLNDLATDMELNGFYNHEYNDPSGPVDENTNDELSDLKVLVPRKYSSSKLDQIFEDGSFAGFLNDLKESRAKLNNELPHNSHADESNLTNNNNKRAKLVKLMNNYSPNKNKKGFQITTLYNVLQKEDGTVLLIPKDSNKNHYFIGK